MQFGFDPRRLFRSIRGIPRYIIDIVQFSKKYEGKLSYLPCLSDWHEEGGTTSNEYFLQDIFVAKKIYVNNPDKHVDIGSRIDGFVAHVASFRSIEVFDIRPVSFAIPGVIFKQADLMNAEGCHQDYCDSVSCLHALEHFGLGRYGDPVDADGYIAGLKNMAALLKHGGLFYLSVPVGKACVEFNAHRIFDPHNLVELAGAQGLSLTEFSWIDASRTLFHSVGSEQDFDNLSKLRYSLGIFTFVKQ